jgi:hypothetical protein
MQRLEVSCAVRHIYMSLAVECLRVWYRKTAPLSVSGYNELPACLCEIHRRQLRTEQIITAYDIFALYTG